MASQRSKKIVELAKAQLITDCTNREDRLEDKENFENSYSFNESDPISNWVLEVDPEKLKLFTSRNTTSSVTKQVQCEDVPLSRIEKETEVHHDGHKKMEEIIWNPYLKERVPNDENVGNNDYVRSSNLKFISENVESSQPIVDTNVEICNNADKIKVLSHYILKDGTDENFTKASQSPQEDKPLNCYLPLVVVPPKETVEHIIPDDNLQIVVETVSTDASRPQLIDNNTDVDIMELYKNSSREAYTHLSDSCEGTANTVSIEFNLDVHQKGCVETVGSKHYKDKKTFCFYCEKDVSHFSRHLDTWHKMEIEVQRIFSWPTKSKQRRNALSDLAKKGNYLRNRTATNLRPVRRVIREHYATTENFLPCPHCLGFYKKKHLYRHSKLCSNLSGIVKTRQSAQSDGQTALLLGTFKYDELLKKELFPRMRADEITLIAKKDVLICKYAYSYIKGRRSKGNLDFVRQNTRRLAKLLQYARTQSSDIKELIDLLQPRFFEIIINGVNKIGGYNAEDDIYESPTVAINFGTLIKKCCSLAILQLLQKSNTERERKEVKVLKTLIESQWANEVSAQAGSNLCHKKWNKEELLPLTSDLEKLKKYLEKNAEDAITQLRVNPLNQEAYNILKEVLYTQIILLNRRRPAEVAQLKVETYKSVNLECQESEFESCLTETEKILLKTCSRIVVRGKRGRGVPILLLSQKMRKHFDILIELRNHFVSGNDYIFHTSGKSFFDGTKVLHKYALKCGAKNPNTISATRLRKHLATVTQLLECSKKDMEQLSKFMGHTLKTHCDFYQLTDDLYQTAKISKLLLLASEEGALEKYKGMDLNEINIDMTPIADSVQLEDLLHDEDDKSVMKEPSYSDKSKVLQKNPILKVAWTTEEKKILGTYFAKHILEKRAPKQSEVEELKCQYPNQFDNRKWTSIKAVVYNMYTKKLAVPL